MENQLSFYEPIAAKRGGRNGSDMWVRKAKSEKTGAETIYVAISRDWAEQNLTIDNYGKAKQVKAALDVGSRVLVSNTGPVVLPGVIFRTEGSTQSSFYSHDKKLVQMFIDSFLCNDEVANHYFKLERDGTYSGHARFKIVKL